MNTQVAVPIARHLPLVVTIAKALGTFVQEVRGAAQNTEKQKLAEDEKQEEGA